MEQYEDKNVLMARTIAARVAEAGGRTFYVGGLVRDHILGRENKDVDIEIHGITPETLLAILESLGEVIKTGVSFGVFGLKSYEIDIAMPRKETATGRGHKDFEIDVDPFLGYEKAAMRRDFTMNAMMEDVLTGEVLDFFGGRQDMQNRLIRHVNDQTYREDALRVLRAAQFAARFGFRIAEETADLSRTMGLEELASERILGEMNKAMLKAEKPSVFFEELRKMDQLSTWFPEAEALIGVPQSQIHHPEGDAWVHTMMVLDAAARAQKGSCLSRGLHAGGADPRFRQGGVHHVGRREDPGHRPREDRDLAGKTLSQKAQPGKPAGALCAQHGGAAHGAQHDGPGRVQREIHHKNV